MNTRFFGKITTTYLERKSNYIEGGKNYGFKRKTTKSY